VVRAFTEEERDQRQRNAHDSLHELLSQFDERYAHAQQFYQSLGPAGQPADLNRIFSDALGQTNFGNTCYANSAHAFLWAMNLPLQTPQNPPVDPAQIARDLNLSAGLRQIVRRVIQRVDELIETHQTPQNPANGYLDGVHPLIGFQHDASEYLTRVFNLLKQDRALENRIAGFHLASQVTFPPAAPGLGERSNALRFEENENHQRSLQNQWELSVRRETDHPEAPPRFFSTLQQALDAQSSPTPVENVELENAAPEGTESEPAPRLRLDGTKKSYLIRSAQGLPRKIILKLSRFETVFTQNPIQPLQIRKVAHRIYANPVISLRYIENEQNLNHPPQVINLNLKAAIIHHGNTPHQGHYTTLVLHRDGWFIHDDRTIRAMDRRTATDLMSQNGYVFLYENPNDPASPDGNAQGEGEEDLNDQPALTQGPVENSVLGTDETSPWLLTSLFEIFGPIFPF
jgi:hypothetical protein